jgi:hypothetical protein
MKHITLLMYIGWRSANLLQCVFPENDLEGQCKHTCSVLVVTTLASMVWRERRERTEKGKERDREVGYVTIARHLTPSTRHFSVALSYFFAVDSLYVLLYHLRRIFWKTRRK